MRIVGMVERLREAVGGPISVDRAWTARNVANLIASPQAAVFVSRNGFIAGSLTPTIINPQPIAVEHGWFADDGNGLRLLRKFEKWATEAGAPMIQLSTGCNGLDLSRFGYRAVETAWVR